MFNILKLATQIALKPYNLTDKESYKKFLLDLIAIVTPLAQKSKTSLDDLFLKHLTFILNNDALFEYVYSLVSHQLQTPEILLESVSEEMIMELCENTVPANAEYPESINPVVIVSLISQIIAIINTLKKSSADSRIVHFFPFITP